MENCNSFLNLQCGIFWGNGSPYLILTFFLPFSYLIETSWKPHPNLKGTNKLIMKDIGHIMYA